MIGTAVTTTSARCTATGADVQVSKRSAGYMAAISAMKRAVAGKEVVTAHFDKSWQLLDERHRLVRGGTPHPTMAAVSLPARARYLAEMPALPPVASR